MNLWTDIPLRGKKNNTFHAVVEIPKGSFVKYEYDHDLGTMMHDRTLRVPMGYPHNYGFFPQTWNQYDQDPMDVLIITPYAINQGVTVPVRVVGMLEMDDSGELDHKIIAVPASDASCDGIQDLEDIPSERRGRLEWFIANYKARKGGNAKVTILGWKGAAAALEFLEECSAAYEKRSH
ncbi:inorganic diphosphatase [Candidatus Peribacteria bacterium]|nr:inorganic diphosphatase [Candidatus Peribacteria bacterium]